MSPPIGLLGDVMLGRGVAEALRERPGEELWTPELRELLRSLDLVVCNLECCISAHGEPTRRIPGKPFFFRGPPAAIAALRATGVDGAGLANNHALDYEEEALADTLDELGGAGIAAAGAGYGEAAARRPARLTADGLRVGLLAVSDHPREFAAGEDRFGIAFADLRRGLPDWLRDELRALREECDAVVCFPHWGPNMTARPSDWQRERARELQEAGAQLVAGHSAHCFHGVEWTAAGPILTDLGDALDDYRVDPELRNDRGLLAIWRPGAGDDELELVGLQLEYCRTGLATGSDADWIANRLASACAELGTSAERLAEQRFRVTPVDVH